MWKTRSILLVLAATVALTSSCIFDPKPSDTPPVENQDPWPDLSTKEDVLYYVQRAYSERKPNKYEQVLDGGFINFLSDGDVNNGLPEQWDRQQELAITDNLFSPTRVGDLPLVKSIDMDVQYESGVSWVEVIPSSAPTEKWYTATAFYFFQITVQPEGATEDLTYYPDLNSKAQFTVRNTGTDAEPVWKLVEFRDLGAGGS